MPKVHEEEGCQFFIYPNDHPPAHVHVKVGDGVVILFLDDELLVREVKGRVKESEIRKVRRVAKANLTKLREAWDTLHA